MIDTVAETLQRVASQPLGLLLALALGVLSVIISACCTLPTTLGIVVGYSGTRENMSRKQAFKKAIFFTVGAIVSLMVIGGVAGFVGQIAQANLGRYWNVFAGIVAIVLGLATLKLLPFAFSSEKVDGIRYRLGSSGEMLAGFALGGVVATSSLCCNPVIFVVIGTAVLQGQAIWAILLLGMYAIGFSVPLGAVLLGVSLGKARFLPKGADTAVRWIAGGILIIVGFYFLITF